MYRHIAVLPAFPGLPEGRPALLRFLTAMQGRQLDLVLQMQGAAA